MTGYAVTLETTTPMTETLADTLLEQLQQHHPAIGITSRRVSTIAVTVDADGLAAASSAALRAVEALIPVRSCSVMLEVERDRLEGLHNSSHAA